MSADSETGSFIRDNRIGLVVPPEEPSALAQAVLQLRRSGGDVMGRNSRRLVETHFDQRIVLQGFAEQVEALVVGRGVPQSLPATLDKSIE